MPRNGEVTFYETLGVTQDVSQEDLRIAWIALARKHHPDRTGGHKGSEAKLKAVNEAYDTLKRPEKRRQYDESLSSPFQSGASHSAGPSDGRAPSGNPGQHGSFAFDGDYVDILGSLFGQRSQGRQRRPRTGRDLETAASISLRESAAGTRKSFSLPSMVLCDTCAGSGAARGTSPQVCPQCQGAGHISAGQGSLFEMSQPCPNCRGRGSIIATPCPNCGGNGTLGKTRTVSIAIPAGIRSGARLRLSGQGELGENGASAGDLFVVITVDEDALFRRRRNDVLCDVPITFTRAVLGGDIDVPTLMGNAILKIPAGTQSGATMRMRGLGFPSSNGGHSGDQLVRVLVEVPVNLTKVQLATVESLHENPGTDSYPRHQAYADGLNRWQTK